MQKHIEITRKRVQKFAQTFSSAIYPLRVPVSLAAFHAPDRISFTEALRGDYQPIGVGEKFAPLWSTHWVRVAIDIPPAWGGEEIHFLWDSASEACIWQEGVPLQGLTGSFSGWADDSIRKEFCLTKHAQGGEQIQLYVEVACNGLFGLDNEAHNVRIGELLQAEVATFNRAAWDLYWDFKVISDMAEYLPGNTPRGGQAIHAANAMVNAISVDDPSTWSAAGDIARRFLSARTGDGQHQLSAIGHAHIDTAWLWPIAETKRKCARSFASALRYMDDYPEYKFACSQAQQYEWIKDSYPALFERIREKVIAGQFIPAGGTWVEPDCNLPSGESLVRQFLTGQRFFEQEFGKRCTEFWNPDVFGYSGALPQIMQQAGIKYFLTQKLSWNQFNKPLSHTFLWEGIDGSRVLTHFPPADTYNATASVREVVYGVDNFKDHERANESYMLFGYGDGGGGPTPGMLEQIQRMSDVDGLPRVQIRTPQEFFARCEADARDLTLWNGELYFELHRGTYTSQARAKQLNRRNEFLLHDVEFLSAIACATRGFDYPGTELEGLWKRLLTNQFHDIIPGSSIGEVYRDSAADHLEIRQRGEALREQVLLALIDESGPASNVCAVNTLSMTRREIAEMPEGVPGSQIAANGRNLAVVSAPPMGWRIASPDTEIGAPVSVTDSAETITLENEVVRAIFNRVGGLVDLFDKRAMRQSIAPGEVGNRFVLFDDQPVAWDAWDVDIFHLEKFSPAGGAISARVTESGPLRASIEFTYALSPHSMLIQTVSLTALSPRLDFTTEVDWHERHRFLKVEFPLNVRAASATYEIQFGHLQRPTHFNTSWDLARFEVCAHKWADLSETGFGVALLNDCKYGYAAQGSTLRLSLLRAPTHPDPEADQGKHLFRYALLPHVGSFQDAGVIDEAYRFNAPLLLSAMPAAPIEISYFHTSKPSVVIETVKRAEDSDALIVRLYEAHGGRGPVRLSSPLPVKSAVICNLLEDDIAPLNWEFGSVTFDVTPFKITTLKLKW